MLSQGAPDPSVSGGIEAEEERLRGFMGALVSAISEACSHSMKTRGKGEVGGGRGGVVVPASEALAASET